METVYERPEILTDVPFKFCPGCGHGSILHLVADVLVELGIRENLVAVFPIGCSATAFDSCNFDVVFGCHGRTPAMATGVKRALPDHFVLVYQGDGDIAAIGTAEIIHAASRGENLTVIYANNGVFGMTGGQMAPTTLLGQKTASSPAGRTVAQDGYPLKIPEMIAELPGVTYAARWALDTVAHRAQAYKSVRKACENQLEERGFSIVEILSPCPSGWRLSPLDTLSWLEENFIPYYPLGVICDKEEGE